MKKRANRPLRIFFIILIVLLVMVISCKITIDNLRTTWHLNLINEIAQKEDLEPAWILAVIMAESKFNPSEISRTGAVGLMQIMPATAERMCNDLGLNFHKLDLTNPDTNITLGCHYLSWLKRRYRGGTTIVFAAYQAGEGAADRWLVGQMPQDFRVEMIPVAETAQYAKSVMNSLFFFQMFWDLANLLS